jgi:ribosomal protein S18 acetylase RimI-like enzyme
MNEVVQMEAVKIQLGLRLEWRKAAAELYWEAFSRKLQPLFGEPARAIRLVASGLELQRAVAAEAESQLVGLAGFHHAGQHFVNFAYRDVIAEYGWLGGTWRYGVGLLLNRRSQPGELLMDGIVTHSDWRGRGVGQRLFADLIAFGQEHRYRAIRLDVVDTNPRARQLYERLGFEPVVTHRIPWLRELCGFSAVTTMKLPLN